MNSRVKDTTSAMIFSTSSKCTLDLLLRSTIRAIILLPFSCTPFLIDRASRTFASRRINNNFSFLRLSSSYNPNDKETPEERRKRMDLVRQIQANFYQSQDEDEEEKWVQVDPSDPSIIYNLPLWRVQWTELPGYQNVLNVHVPHYTHMFRKLLRQQQQHQHSKPLFGHVYLKEGSKNLGNPDFFLPEREPSDMDTIPDLEEIQRMANVPLTGTLMQITDHVEHEDGRLTLIVQGVAPMKILAASQQVPYAIASKVEVLLDRESWENDLLLLLGGGTGGVGASVSFQESMAYTHACQSMASKELEVLRGLEYYHTTFERKNDNDSPITWEISPLSNVNGSIAIDFDELHKQKQKAFRSRLSREAQTRGNDEILLASSTLLPGQCNDTDYEWEGTTLSDYERNVWIQLDRMIQLLEKAQPGLRIQVPSQLLGLLPINAQWPPGFRLQEYAQQMEDNKTRIGTFSKSPFVRISKAVPQYPSHRRASRLSYAIWLLLESIVTTTENGGTLDRQGLLEMRSICERLQKATRALENVNNVIQGMPS